MSICFAKIYSTLVITLGFSIDLDSQDFINKLFPNGWQPVVIQLLAFGVLVLAGTFLGYKPVKRLLTKRAEYVESHIKDAEEQKHQAEVKMQEADKAILDSKKEARNILNSAKSEGEKEHDKLIIQAQDEIKNQKVQADIEIAKSKEQAKKDIHDEIVSVALDASKAILAREVNENDNSRLVDDFIKEVDK